MFHQVVDHFPFLEHNENSLSAGGFSPQGSDESCKAAVESFNLVEANLAGSPGQLENLPSSVDPTSYWDFDFDDNDIGLDSLLQGDLEFSNMQYLEYLSFDQNSPTLAAEFDTDVQQSDSNATLDFEGARSLIDDDLQYGGEKGKQNPADPQDNNEESVAKVKACLVCGGEGSGFHYCAYSCQACKGFFKRTVQRKLSYTCKADKNCEVTAESRSKCQACRFEKCLQVGMILPGAPLRYHENVVSWHTNPTSPKDAPLPNWEPYSDDFVQAMIDARPDLVPKDDDCTGEEPLDGCELLSANEIDATRLMAHGHTELKLVIRWARQVPGFCDLDSNDQMRLIKNNSMELLAFRLVFRSMQLRHKIKFANNIVVSHEEVMQMGCDENLLTYLVEYIKRMQRVWLDHTEFCILNAMILMHSDGTGISNASVISSLQTKMLASLRKYIMFHHSYPVRRYARVLLLLPALRTVGFKATQAFLLSTSSGRFQLSALALEMLT